MIDVNSIDINKVYMYSNINSILSLLKKEDFEELYVDISLLRDDEVEELKKFLQMSKFYYKIIQNGRNEKILYIKNFNKK